MIRPSKLLGVAFAVLFVLAPAATSFAQEEEAPLIEEPTLWQSTVDTVREVVQEYNGTSGDSQAEQIVDDTGSESGEQ